MRKPFAKPASVSENPADKVNLERSLTFDQRLDGHVVQGHVDTVGTVKEVLQEETGWLYTIAFPDEYADYIVGRGSIALDGISLTVARDQKNRLHRCHHSLHL